MPHAHPHLPHGGREALAAGRRQDRRALAAALAITSVLCVLEVVGGLVADSLALLADAGHLLSDAAALGLALGAAWLAGRPASAHRSFGYQRAEVLAALANAVALVAVAIWVATEAVSRLGDPPDVAAGWLLVLAAVGLAGNGAAAAVLARTGRGGVNVRAALRHVLADALGSVGVLTAGLVIALTGWHIADPLIGLAIALLVAGSAWGILRESIPILLEATPRGLDAEALGRRMATTHDVVEVHDLHVWTITSGFPSLSAHVLVRHGADPGAVRRRLERLLHDEFDIDHTTLQVEHEEPEQLLRIEPPTPPPGAPADAPPGR